MEIDLQDIKWFVEPKAVGFYEPQIGCTTKKYQCPENYTYLRVFHMNRLIPEEIVNTINLETKEGVAQALDIGLLLPDKAIKFGASIVHRSFVYIDKSYTFDEQSKALTFYIANNHPILLEK